jgi:AcrR family transcriptional regulator
MTDSRYAASTRAKPPGREHAAVRRRGDGERSHLAILEAATRLSTIQGLDGLSIGELAAHIGMSKSGLYAHFRSKEELQLATVTAALEVVDAEVVQPALSRPDALGRLIALADNFLSYAQHSYPGGCFFSSAGAEFDTRPGPVRDVLIKHCRVWADLLAQLIKDAQQDGSIDSREDPAQLAFELNSFLHLANDWFVLLQDAVMMERAHRSVNNRLRAAAPASDDRAQVGL